MIYQKTLISFSVVDIYKEYTMKIIICRGLPASGKTTWAKEWVMKDPEHRVRVNQDDVRLMLGKYWVPDREKLVSIILYNAIARAMQYHFDIVVDNTNLNPKVLNKIETMIEGCNKDFKVSYTIEYENFFNISLEECIRRNAIRNDSLPKDRQITDTVIVDMYERYKDVYNLKAN